VVEDLEDGVFMKKTFLVLISTMLLLTLGAGGALALQPNGEPYLTEVLNTSYGSGTYHEIANTYEFEFNPGPYEVTAILVSKNAGFNNPTGWYAAANPNNKNLIFDNPRDEVGESTKVNLNGKFGLYINSNIGTFYSKASLNSDGKKHARLFMIDQGPDAGAYVLGFEDLDQQNGSDWDYQDIVVELKGVNLSIPEFPTVALPIAAIIGLVFMFGRKNEKL
jgi:hypothetical protein